jgi:hypothetical protein
MEAAHYKAIAIRQGVDPETLIRRPLTYAEYDAMSEPEKNYHLCENSAACDKAFAEHEKELREVKRKTQETKRKIATYDVDDVPVLANLMIENGGKFSVLFPQFIGSRKNTDRVLKYMRDNELLPDVENLVVAFQALAHAGEISIDPSKTGLTDDSTELTGTALQGHPNLAHLLTRVTPQLVEQRKVMRMSDSNFKAWQREKEGAPDIPPLIKVRIDQAFVTFASMHPEFIFNDANKTKLLAYLNDHYTNIDYNTIKLAYEALKKAGELDLNLDVRVQAEHATWTDYSQIEPNKQLTDKQESLSEKIGRMNADEFAEFISRPANRRAVDNLH